MYQHGGAAWTRWNSAVRDQLVSSQEASGHQAGSWNPAICKGKYDSLGGRIYSTAVATLTLEVYYRYLRLHDRPGTPPLIAPKPDDGPGDPTLRRAGNPTTPCAAAVCLRAASRRRSILVDFPLHHGWTSMSRRRRITLLTTLLIAGLIVAVAGATLGSRGLHVVLTNETPSPLVDVVVSHAGTSSPHPPDRAGRIGEVDGPPPPGRPVGRGSARSPSRSPSPSGAIDRCRSRYVVNSAGSASGTST